MKTSTVYREFKAPPRLFSFKHTDIMIYHEDNSRTAAANDTVTE